MANRPGSCVSVDPDAKPSDAIRNPRHEMFAQEYIRSGFNGKAAYARAFGISAEKRKGSANATRLLALAHVRRRIRYLIDEEARQRITVSAINKDKINSKMWEVVEKSMAVEKLDRPPALRNRKPRDCDHTEDCEDCTYTRWLLDEWMQFGGIYKFDARNAIEGMRLLGKDIGLYIDKKIHAHVDVDAEEMSRERLEAALYDLAEFLGYAVLPKNDVEAKLELLADKYGYVLSRKRGADGEAVQDQPTRGLQTKRPTGGVPPSGLH